MSYLERKGILSIVVSDNYEISGNGFHKTLTLSLLQICGLCLKGVCARKPSNSNKCYQFCKVTLARENLTKY